MSLASMREKTNRGRGLALGHALEELLVEVGLRELDLHLSEAALRHETAEGVASLEQVLDFRALRAG